MEVPSSILKSISEDNMKEVFRCIENIKFGSITLILHEGKVVFVEKLEKLKI
ncbi:hypothetical protein FACS1894191_4910 [Clostridia bacterium]|nr:hypothetical protein FACS1894191_4910 [Clostridia bacterium]